jgi:hypothetical protein
MPTRAWSLTNLTSRRLTASIKPSAARTAARHHPREPAGSRNRPAPVAHILGDKAAGITDHVAGDAVVGGADLAEILGIELRRQGGRADQVAKQHRQLAPLGLSKGRPGGFGCLDALPEGPDRVKQPPAVTDRCDTQLAQILGREPTQDLSVNIVVAERWPVLFEPEAAQPFGHIHSNCLERASCIELSTTGRHPVQVSSKGVTRFGVGSGARPVGDGLEVGVSPDAGRPDDWRREIAFWKEAGVTHITAHTAYVSGHHKRIAGRTAADHLAALTRYRDAVADLL